MPVRHGMLALLLAGCATSGAEPAAQRTAYVNARIFDGDRFAQGAVVTEGDRIVDADPSTASQRIDLEGGYVVPPFCEAHNHNLGRPHGNEASIARYLREGIFYVGVLSNLPAITNPIRHTYNTPAV